MLGEVTLKLSKSERMISGGQPLTQEIRSPLMDLVEALAAAGLPLEQSWIRFPAKYQSSQHTRSQSQPPTHKSRSEARFGQEVEGFLQ